MNDETSHDALTAWMTALVAAAVDGAAEAVAAAAAGESSGATAAVAIFRALSLEDNAPMAVGLANVGDCNALVLSSAEGVANEVPASDSAPPPSFFSHLFPALTPTPRALPHGAAF